MNDIAAIIPVAGLSSRMGRFKPLLMLNGFFQIQLTVQSALDGGARNVCVVTGHNAGEVEAALSPWKRGCFLTSGCSAVSEHSPASERSLASERSAASECSPASGCSAVSEHSPASEYSQASEYSLVQGLEPLPLSVQGSLFFTHNPAYAESDMLCSIQLGLRALLELATPPQAVFVLPGDMPGVSPRTFAALQQAFLRQETEETGGGSAFETDKGQAIRKQLHSSPVCNTAQVFVSTYQGKRGHPLLVDSVCFDALLSFAEEGGLKQALQQFTWQEVEVNDPGILLDADTPQALETVESHVRKTRGVSSAVVHRLYAEHETPSNVQAHTQAVGEVALRMARALNQQGLGLDSELCRSGGCLHDLNRLEPEHSQVAAAHLKAQGYDALAAVVTVYRSRSCICSRQVG